VKERGDELELLEYALSAWEAAEIDEGMHLHALTVLLAGFLPILVFAEVVERAEPSADVDWLASFDADAVRSTLERSGIAAWCEGLGFPLQLDGDPLGTVRKLEEPWSPDDALAVIRGKAQPPDLTTELEAHEVLDAAVREALPVGRDTLKRVQAEEDFSRSELIDLRLASLKLLAACRLIGPVVTSAIAWGEPDRAGLEDWVTYHVLASILGLNLRLLAETSSAAERSARLHLNGEDLAEIAQALDRSNPDIG
jgi:hypothetical protein